jgi:hypothetical protein
MNYSDFYRNHSLPVLICALILSITAVTVVRRTTAQTTASLGASTDKTQKVDRNRLEVIEELSESLANDLLELSVATRDRDLQLTAEFFPVSIAAKPFPSRPTLIKNGWAEFLAHFSEIEDARFKVKEANFDETAKAVLGAEQPTAVVGATGKRASLFTSSGATRTANANGRAALSGRTCAR